MTAGEHGCLCPGRAEGRHGLLCEDILRGAFGSVGDAPEDVKQLMCERGRLVPGTVTGDEMLDRDPVAFGREMFSDDLIRDLGGDPETQGPS